MESRQVVVSCLSLIVLTACCNGQRLECYHCFSEGNPQCMNIEEANPPFVPTLCMAESEANGRPRCLKEVQIVKGRTVVRRTCVMALLDDYDAACAYASEDTIHCSLCDSDSCNAAPQYSTPAWILLWSAIIWTTWRIL
ncbi:uncharacterized protein [Anabrus simplex]|uniref:uncharacterized protein n=1 Tax=Anabrus simplex TaxID=316456 RepID=UPI0035A3A0B8